MNFRQFLPQGNTVKMTVQPQRLIDTAPQGLQNNSKAAYNQKGSLISTDKVSLNKQYQDTNTEATKFDKQSSKGKDIIEIGSLN